MSEMPPDLAREAHRSYQRLLPFLQNTFATEAATHPKDWKCFLDRLEEQFPCLFNLYYQIHHTRYDFFYHLEDLVAMAGRLWLERPAALKRLDASRQADPTHKHEDSVFEKLANIDIQFLTSRIQAEVLWGIGLMDTICPPSTQVAVYNKIVSPKEMTIYPDFEHEPFPGINDQVFQFMLGL
jgi:hypothetical protein